LIIILVLIIGYGTVLPFIGKLHWESILIAMERDETLTGRNEIWLTLIPFAMKKLIWGYGFGGFWTEEMREAIASHAHNGYLDIILNIGLTGHIFLSIFLLSCCRRAQKEMTKNFHWGIFIICCLLMAVVHNMAESSFIGITGKLQTVILFLYVSSTVATTNKQVVPKIV